MNECLKIDGIKGRACLSWIEPARLKIRDQGLDRDPVRQSDPLVKQRQHGIFREHNRITDQHIINTLGKTRLI